MVAPRATQPSFLARLVLASLLLLASAASTPAQGTVMVTWEIPTEPAVLVGGPVFLDAKIQNNSSDTVRVNMGHHGKWNYEFTLVNPDGTTTPIPAYRQFGPGPKGTVSVEPHQTRTRRLVFNEWYTFVRPGDYTLKVQLTVLLSSSANVSWQKEFFEDLAVKVAPRDAEKLREICAKLAETAVSVNSPEAAADASLALSYVVDPVAVPFLAKVLKEGEAAAQVNAVRGLTRIGSQEALAALKSNLATAGPDLKAKIESALSQFRPGT